MGEGLWVVRRRGRQKFHRFSEDLVTPQAFADPRLAYALLKSTPRDAASEGSPVLREPALTASEAMDGAAQAASRERRAWMPEANVRRRGMGDPEATFGMEAWVASL